MMLESRYEIPVRRGHGPRTWFCGFNCPRSCARAMTLIEIIVSLAIMAIIFTVILPQFVTMRNSWDSKQAAAETLQNGRILIDHLNRNLSKAVRITAVSDSSITNGYIQFLDNDGDNLRYEIVDSYVQFGVVGSLSDLAGPVSQLQFSCYDACDLDTPLDPITDASLIRCVKVETTLTKSAALGQDKSFTIQIYLRTNSDGLVGRWKLDETSGLTAADSSGPGNDGNLTDMAGNEWTTGRIDGALEFDGVDDYISIGDKDSLDFGATESFTYSIWVYVSSSAGAWDMPWYKGGAADAEPGYDMELGTGHWKASISDGSTTKQVLFGYESDFLNEWVLLTAVVDRDAAQFLTYVNGSPVGSVDLTGFGSVANSRSATIGAKDYYGTWYPFKGIIDDVHIYNCALSEEEVAALYYLGGRLVGHWKLDDGSGTTAADSSGNGNDGTLINMSSGQDWVTGKFDGALDFDGVDDYISIGDKDSLDFGATESFTYSIWVYVSSSAGAWDMPWYKGGAADAEPGYDMELGTGHWKASISDGSTTKQVLFGYESDFLNEWVLLTAVVDRDAAQFLTYVNGSPVGSVDLTGFGSVANSRSATIGAKDYYGTWYPFKGIIDDVHIYNRTLSEEEITALYNGDEPPSGGVQVYPYP